LAAGLALLFVAVALAAVGFLVAGLLVFAMFFGD
jgi:hypothetical protein